MEDKTGQRIFKEPFPVCKCGKDAVIYLLGMKINGTYNICEVCYRRDVIEARKK